MVPWPKPANYNRSDWALLLKYAEMPINQRKTVPKQGGLGGNNHGQVPNGKHDMNNGGLISTDCAYTLRVCQYQHRADDEILLTL